MTGLHKRSPVEWWREGDLIALLQHVGDCGLGGTAGAQGHLDQERGTRHDPGATAARTHRRLATATQQLRDRSSTVTRVALAGLPPKRRDRLVKLQNIRESV